MISRVRKWGNSLALRTPRPLAADASLKENSTVELSVCRGKLIVTPSVTPRVEQANLLSKVTKENLHGEADTGPAMGSEAW